MNCCLQESARLKHDTIWLTVWRHNLIAQKFYDKWNFEECGAFDFQLGKTICVDKVMQRQILLK
jgi:ribosomal protein S18 acetylase RimI-like enzyme